MRWGEDNWIIQKFSTDGVTDLRSVNRFTQASSCFTRFSIDDQTALNQQTLDMYIVRSYTVPELDDTPITLMRVARDITEGLGLSPHSMTYTNAVWQRFTSLCEEYDYVPPKRVFLPDQPTTLH